MPKTPAEIQQLRFEVAKVAFELDEHDLKYLSITAKVVNRANGCDTPAEQFLQSVLRLYDENDLTPESVEDDLPEFRQSLKLMAVSSRLFAARFPKLMEEPEESVTHA